MVPLGDERQEAAPDQLLGRLPERAAVGRVDEGEGEIRQGAADQLGLKLHDGAVTLLALAQGGLGLHLSGHVAHGGHHALELPRLAV